ncbi:MAG: bifunctional N-acetylglucosamine-1-phosphate uridyltransferase/glucosamine-1-phosphate acetyltransferase [Candidatus Aminicenantes bacterium]|nr:bifunctional N-acetylglucosamine-1-phosphate uridyltransferase/glucosamine-1-phosphate acetyltransferase [Candidatus Aminicenantes bacterium]
MDGHLTGLILAEGGGDGFKSQTPKVLHPLLGVSMLRLSVEAVRAAGPVRIIVAAGIPAEVAAAELAGHSVEIVALSSGKGQAPLRRTLGKVAAGNPDGDILVVPADVPTVDPALLRALVARHRRQGYACTMLWADIEHQGDIKRRNLARSIEARKPVPSPTHPHRVPTGIFVFQTGDLRKVFSKAAKAGPSGRFDPAAAFSLLASSKRPLGVFLALDPDDVRRIRTRHALGQAAERMRLRKARALADAGVTVLSPGGTWIDWAVRIGPETVVYPGAVIEGPTVIGRNCRIYPNAHISGSTIGNDVHVLSSTVIDEATLEDDVRIGPFARVRMQTVLRSGSRVGNFVEMKKTDFGPGSKAMHLSYLGDSEVGPAANIGAGTITCNYDGVNKNRTVIGPGAFIGSGSELVAPVRIGKGAYVAAGSVITKDVADDALAVARGHQVEKPGWAAARREKLAAAKKTSGHKK